jgi:hypothetical protein
MALWLTGGADFHYKFVTHSIAEASLMQTERRQRRAQRPYAYAALMAVAALALALASSALGRIGPFL